MDRTPYTYLIGWSHLNLWYYGVKYAVGCHPDQLWVSYFTSSKYVAETRAEHGEPDIVEIRKVFDDTKSARYWENTVLRRLKVVYDDKWLNKTDNKSISPECCSHQKCLGLKRSEESRAKMRKSWETRDPISEDTREKLRVAATSKRHSEESKKKISEGNKGKTLTEEHKDKVRQARIGSKASDETRIKMSESATGRKMSAESIEKTAAAHRGKSKPSEKIKDHARRLGQIKMTCPHCNKEGSMANMKRWHFDNCKSKPSDLFELFE
jgi:hypothetical protein